MAIGSGMGSSFGIAVQTASYTTRVAPDTFFVANSYSINRTQNRVQGEGILGGNFGDLLDHYVETINGAEATVSFDVQSKKMGKFLNGGLQRDTGHSEVIVEHRHRCGL